MGSGVGRAGWGHLRHKVVHEGVPLRHVIGHQPIPGRLQLCSSDATVCNLHPPLRSQLWQVQR